MGNVAISATDGETIALFGMGNNPNWWELAAGELKFDLYIDSAVTPEDSSISFKMDSGWPALGFKTLAVADLPKDTWTTLSIPVNDLLAMSGDQPLDTSAIVNLFIVEFSGAAHIQLDNIALVCGHKNDEGCGISPPPVEIETEIVEVFTDAVNDTLWTNGIGAWGTGAGVDYYEGDTTNHVNWAMVDTAETGHDTVVEVTFNADGNDGVFYFQSGQPVDMSSLNAGSLIFDIKVTDYGSNTSGMVYKVDCTDPCSTGDQVLGVVGDGEWETITIPVADLITAGLDTSKVNAPLVLFPTWGDQQGVIFQLDNVRWEKAGTEPGPEPEPTPDGELVVNGGFDSGDANWVGATVIDEDGNSVFQATVASAGNPWDVNLSQVMTLVSGQTYTLTFKAKAEFGRAIIAGLGFNHAPWDNVVETVTLTTDWATYSYDFTPGFGDDNSRVLFDMGAEAGNVFLDDISVVIVE
jgi:hypothetical protein